MKPHRTFVFSTALSGRKVANLIVSVPFHVLQVLFAGFFALALSVGFAHGQQAVATNPGSKYVGAEECKTCHEDIYKSFEKSPHWKTLLDKRGGASKQGCEGCHGPGQAHIEGGGDKTKIFSFLTASGKDVNERCLECHASGKDHANFSRSTHSESNVSCLSCHSSHHAAIERFLLLKPQTELCYSCHLKMKAQFNMPFHHRVEEGLINCADCHNPHGGFLRKQLRSAAGRDIVCFTCHVDKQGPFVFEHPGGKVEGCQSCHSPHGSPNPHLLKASNLNVFCLKCHTASTFSSASGTPDFHNQAAQYQACTLCHEAIHGSNFDRHLLK
jgi:DmsE family decaheme c-type cytochrome